MNSNSLIYAPGRWLMGGMRGPGVQAAATKMKQSRCPKQGQRLVTPRQSPSSSPCEIKTNDMSTHSASPYASLGLQAGRMKLSPQQVALLPAPKLSQIRNSILGNVKNPVKKVCLHQNQHFIQSSHFVSLLVLPSCVSDKLTAYAYRQVYRL
jgi:hypothetical protein